MSNLSDNFNPQPKPEIQEAGELIMRYGVTSVGFICRHMKVDRFKGMAIMKELEEKGIVGPFEGHHRKVLVTNLDKLK